MNPIIFLVLCVVLIGSAFYLVALPILQHARRESESPSQSLEQEHLDDLLADREAAFQALRELTFDHRVGKITDDDFVAFEAHLKQNAAERLRALDAWEDHVDEELDAAMERAIQQRRAALTGGAANGWDGRACPKCGRAAASEDRFCGACGATLPAAREATASQAATLACGNCGLAYRPGDKFCAGCGQGLMVEAAPQRAS